MLHQRICDAVFVVALAIGGFQLWQRFASPGNMDPLLRIPDLIGYAALGTAVVAAGLRFVSARSTRLITSMVAYIALFITAGMLVLGTGGASSKYLSVWVVVALFAPLFGTVITVACLAAAVAFIVLQYTTGVIAIGGLVALSLAAIIPLIVGLLAWGFDDKPDTGQTEEDKSYSELANELSQVAGKSEVVINAIADGVLALDSKGTIQLINPAAQQLIGWTKHDALSLSYKSVLKIINIKNEIVSESEDPIIKALSTNKQVFTDQLSLQTNSGKNFIASISVSPVGQLGKGVIVVFRDVTNEKSDERQRAEFISTASHEMRTPVASIEGYLGLALNPATAQIDAKARDFITKAHESAQHLGHLFQDLLDVSKADDGRMQNNPTVIDVIPFMHEVVTALTPKAAAKNLRITYKPAPDGDVHDELSKRLNPVYYVNVDRDHLREVCDNLVENAIKYTPQGEVVVDVGGDQAHVVITIQDTGIGIPKEDQAHLFQKFYRVDNSDTREIGGTGLGLYLCRKLTETMGGRIWIESEYKKGSTFFVELPRLDHDEAQRLIEQASILAEQQANQEAQKAAEESIAVQQAQMAQMNTTNSFTPPVAPIATPVPTQAPPVVQPSQVPVQVVAAPVAQPPSPPNTPLSIIEANPSGYTTRPPASGVSIPPRQQ
ncbi:PAS domain-containing protein [Candidatus Saccharibacteria bacterium]|nr:MAG: PAS domain-containing protein [Candidatus Saccharibacteria bacterium]